MSFFKRLKNIVSAKANKALDKHEDPIELLNLSIQKKEELLKEAKKQSAHFIASVDSMKKENNSLISKSKKYEEATKAALKNGDNEKAQTFMKQKLDIDAKFNEANERIKDQENKITAIKTQISDLELEISKMKSKKQELATRLDLANTSSAINETLAGVSDDNGINLDELERRVTEKENYSSALEDLKPKDEDAILDEYIKSSSSADTAVNDELERLKKELNL